MRSFFSDAMLVLQRRAAGEGNDEFDCGLVVEVGIMTFGGFDCGREISLPLGGDFH